MGLAIGLDVADLEVAARAVGVDLVAGESSAAIVAVSVQAAGRAAHLAVELGAGVVDLAVVSPADQAGARSFEGLLGVEDEATQVGHTLVLQHPQVGCGGRILQEEERGGAALRVLCGLEDGLVLVGAKAAVVDGVAAAVVGLGDVGAGAQSVVAHRAVAVGLSVEQELVVDGLVAGGGRVAAGRACAGVEVGVGRGRSRGDGDVQPRHRPPAGLGRHGDARFDGGQVALDEAGIGGVGEAGRCGGPQPGLQEVVLLLVGVAHHNAALHKGAVFGEAGVGLAVTTPGHGAHGLRKAAGADGGHQHPGDQAQEQAGPLSARSGRGGQAGGVCDSGGMAHGVLLIAWWLIFLDTRLGGLHGFGSIGAWLTDPAQISRRLPARVPRVA